MNYMTLAIAILLGLHFIVDLIDDGDVALFSSTAFILVLWNLCFPLAMVVLGIIILVILVNIRK